MLWVKGQNWLVNYLTYRHQFVQNGTSRSNLCKMDCGIPHGSILRPLVSTVCKWHCLEYGKPYIIILDDTTLVAFFSDSEPRLFKKGKYWIQHII